MPIYEYRCEACGVELEQIQKFSDPPLRDCPTCGKSALVKLVSAPSFRLKGGGWYETDFKTGNKKHGTADAAKDTGSGQEAGDAAKTTAKTKSTETSASSSTDTAA